MIFRFHKLPPVSARKHIYWKERPVSDLLVINNLQPSTLSLAPHPLQPLFVSMNNPQWPICQTPKLQNAEQTRLEGAGHYGASLNRSTDHSHRCVCSGSAQANNIATTALLFSHTHKMLFELQENDCSWWAVHLFLVERTGVCVWVGGRIYIHMDPLVLSMKKKRTAA